MARSRRFSLTLLEVLIALSLATILLSALLTSYYQLSKKRQLTEALKKNCLNVELARQKLNFLFAQSAVADTLLFQTATHPDAVGSCLLLNYDNGIDLNPNFRGQIKAMVYQDNAHQLCLASWGKNAEVRKDVLLQNISGIDFCFFEPNKKIWKSNWKKADPFPPFFKLRLSFTDLPSDTLECAFFYAKQDPILYETQVLMP